MATYNIVVRTNKEYNNVYIRLSHKSKTEYINTTMVVHKSGIKKGKIVDFTIISNCSNIIKSYIKKTNDLNIDSWTVQEIKKYVTSDTSEISFSTFAEKYIEKMKRSGRQKPAENYRVALNSFEKFFGKKVIFNEITSKKVREWIESLNNTSRAKELYPSIIKKLFSEGCVEYNDYERDIIKIKHNPFISVKIPKASLPADRHISITELNKILDVECETKREELAKDVAKLILCLAGINTVDLYNIEQNELIDNKLCYNRTKEKNTRLDKAYFEIHIVPEAYSIINKYKGKKKLLNFSENYSNADNFSKAINMGLKSLAQKAGCKQITCYWLRHVWATTAQNVCGASIEKVAFSLNHSSAHRVTEKYIKKDFSIVDELNKKVIEYIFKKTPRPSQAEA